MKIVRYENAIGQIGQGAQQADGSISRIDGEIFGTFTAISEPVAVMKILAPNVPTSILGIGPNYRKYAEETQAPFPKWPILFHSGFSPKTKLPSISKKTANSPAWSLSNS